MPPRLLLIAGCALIVVSFQLWISASNPPGFHHDEAAFALNAYTLGHSLRGQDGARLPVLLPSYGDYKSSAFAYALAPVVDIFGAHKMVVRAFAAVLGLTTVLLIGLIAYRRFRSVALLVCTLVMAGLTPWLFQISRVAYDTAMFPFAAALVILAVEWWAHEPKWRAGSALAVGGALAFMTYGYAAGRLLGVLLAVSLIVFVRRVPFRDIATVWLTYALLLLPLCLYEFRHPSGLSARYHQTTFVTSGMSKPGIIARAAWNWLQDLNPFYWLAGYGDPKPYTDVGAGQLLAVTMLLAFGGFLCIVTRRTRDRWWVWLLLGLLLTPIPAALTPDRHDTLRLAAVPVFYLVMASLGLHWLITRTNHRAVTIALAVGAVALMVQWAYFVDVYSSHGPGRTALFDADVPMLLQRAFSGGATVYMDHDDRYAETQARWYALSHGIGSARVSVLPDGGVAPPGAMVFGRTQECDYGCTRLAEADTFWIARSTSTP